MEKGVKISENDSENLLITFGGIRQGIGIPAFEFQKSLDSINSDKIFIRDYEQSWYQLGAKPYNSFNELYGFLKTEIDKKKYKKVSIIGNSMGGYAAILFGLLLKVDEVIAFSPQTFIDHKTRILKFDFRWFKQVVKANFKRQVGLNISDSFNKKIETRTIFKIYYSDLHRLDRIHAELLSEFKSVQLKPIHIKSHNIVKHLKETGELNNILTNLF